LRYAVKYKFLRGTVTFFLIFCHIMLTYVFLGVHLLSIHHGNRRFRSDFLNLTSKYVARQFLIAYSPYWE
jgi:hypothetical protein